jgi:hypothetical protein
MHPLFLLAIATFILIIGFLAWNLVSNRRHKFNRDVSGIGGEHDPLSGKSEGIRNADDMRASLDEAAGYPANR